MDNNYELESRTAPPRPSAAVADAPTPASSAPAKTPHAMARREGLDFTPIVTHYVFLVTFVLALVSNLLRCVVAPPPPS